MWICQYCGPKIPPSIIIFSMSLQENWGTPVVVIFGRDHILQVCLGHVRSYLLAFSDQSESWSFRGFDILESVVSSIHWLKCCWSTTGNWSFSLGTPRDFVIFLDGSPWDLRWPESGSKACEDHQLGKIIHTESAATPDNSRKWRIKKRKCIWYLLIYLFFDLKLEASEVLSKFGLSSHLLREVS